MSTDLNKRLHQWRRCGALQRSCAVCGAVLGSWQAHHVVYRQAVRRERGDEWDTRNVLRVCDPDHFSHHSTMKRIPLHSLTDDNFAFARDLLGGNAAYEYLSRHYDDDPDNPDQRLEALLAEE